MWYFNKIKFKINNMMCVFWKVNKSNGKKKVRFYAKMYKLFYINWYECLAN